MTVDEHLFDDCDYSPDPPPPDGSSDFDLTANHLDRIVNDLAAAARGDDPAGRLSMALYHLTLIRREPDRAQLGALTTAIVEFASVAASVLPPDIPRPLIHEGLANAFWLAGFNGVAPEARRDALRDAATREQLADVAAHVRILRNAAHNSALQEGVRRRQRERDRQAAISAFGDEGPGAKPGH
jgi:hypothetical protein